MTSTTARPGAGTRELDVDWTRTAGLLTWVPEQYREPAVTESAARLSLRCTAESFAQLVDLGLPATEGPDGLLFDLVDLKNAGLYSGTGATDVEVGMRFVLRYLHESPAELTRPRRWSYGLRLLPEAGGTDPMRVYRPTPEDAGGELHTWRPATAYAEGDLFTMTPGSEVSGALTTAGEADTIVSPLIRQTMDDLLDSGLRWQYVPKTLELSPLEATDTLGGGSCAVLCAVLVDMLEKNGVPARSCHGWMIAVSQVIHSWVEVVDDDGRRKFLDPSLALLAARNGFGPAEFREFATGSKINRIVLTRCPLLESFVAGEPYDLPDTTIFTCRAAGS